MLTRQSFSSVRSYALTICICLVAMVLTFELPRATLTVPFTTRKDALSHAMVTKGVIDNGWYLTNPYLGAPESQTMYDYPLADNNLHLLALKTIALAIPHHAVAMNLYYLITFPLTAVSALFVFRRFGVSFPAGAFGSLVYAFLPYHFARGETHLFLSAYYHVPLMILVILWVGLQQSQSAQTGESVSRTGLTWPKLFASVLICALMGSGGIYYAFFGAGLLIVAGGWVSVTLKSFRPLVHAAVLVSIMVASLVANFSPTILYRLRHGTNPTVTQRAPHESEIYGMKIIQLLLPVPYHRIPALASLRHTYDSSSPETNDEITSAFGLVGTCGFLGLIACLFWCTQSRLLRLLAILNCAAVLVGTAGGFGTVFAYTISPQIRAYSRISIYIAFLSIFLVVLGLEAIRKRMETGKLGKALFKELILFLLVIGIADQTSPSFVPNYEDNQRDDANDAAFVSKIEDRLSAGAMVFQLPYVPFPENPPVYAMTDYDHLRGYLHSRGLRWSYGAMKGSATDAWQKETASKDAKALIGALREAGFSGLYLDRLGYPDRAREIVGQIGRLLGQEPLVSRDARLVFFALKDREPPSSNPKQ